MPKGRERHKQVLKHKRLPERVWDQKKITKMVCSMEFSVALSANLVLAAEALPLRPPIGSIINCGKCGCPTAFIVCFEERGWPSVDTAEMRQDWATTRSSGMESQVETLIHEIVEIHREAYYTLRRSQADQVVVERAREESAAKLAAERAAWKSERAALLDK